MVFKCQHSLLDCFDSVNKSIEKKMEESMTTKLLKNARRNYQKIQDICQTKWKKQFGFALHWSIEKWVSVLAKVGGQKKWFQYCLNPNHLHQFRAIQGHSGSTNNLALQDNVLLPEGFTEYIYDVRNRKELRSRLNHGLTPGGVSLKTGPCTIICKRFQNKVFWCNVELAVKKDCNFIKQDRTHLFSTTHGFQSSLRKRYACWPRISFIKG